MKTETHITSDLSVLPGDYLLEVMKEVGLSQADLASSMEISLEDINEIINGRLVITTDMASQLEKTLGVPVHIWIGLEEGFRFV